MPISSKPSSARYEMAGQRFSEFRITRHETTLEWVIIVLLAAETLLLLIEVLLHLRALMRYLSIDILRGGAIVLMIQVHFVENLSSRSDGASWLDDASLFLGLLPAPLFTFVSGVSYGLWLRKQEAAGRCDGEITKITVRRGLFLFAAGIAFNVLVWLPEDTFNWDILTLIGTALLVLAFARKLPPPILILTCVMILLLSPLLPAACDYGDYWKYGYYSYDFTVEDVFFGFIANGYFPVFPWIIFPFIGFVVGGVVFPVRGRPVPLPLAILLLGAGFMLVSLLGVLLRESVSQVLRKHYLAGFAMFPPSTEYVLGTLGVSMVGLVLLNRWVDQNERITGTGRFLSFLRIFSVYSLTLYVLHHVAHLWPLWICGTWMHGDSDYYWRKALSTPAGAGPGGRLHGSELSHPDCPGSAWKARHRIADALALRLDGAQPSNSSRTRPSPAIGKGRPRRSWSVVAGSMPRR